MSTQAVPLIIAGRDVHGDNQFAVNNPDGRKVWDASGASVQDAVKAVEAAEAAAPAWSATKPAVRRDIFLRASEIFADRFEELAKYQTEETGAERLFIEWILKLTIENLKEVAGKCSLVQGNIPSSDEEGRAALVFKEPYGVILGIAPWYVSCNFDCSRYCEGNELETDVVFLLGMPHGPSVCELSRMHLQQETPASSKDPNSRQSATTQLWTFSGKPVYRTAF